MKIFLILIALSFSLFGAELEGDAKVHVKDNFFVCPNTGIKFPVPDLNTQKLQVQHREAVPGITNQLIFVEELGHVMGVTYTKIRAEYPKTDEVLERTASVMKAEAMREGGYLEWCGFLSEENGKVFQCVIRYPMGGNNVSIYNKWLKREEQVSLDVYELRHYVVRNGYMAEFKLFIPQLLPKGKFDEDKLIDSWSEKLVKFAGSTSLIGKDDIYHQQLKNFKRPDSYFRFEFLDPSQN